MSSGMPVRRQSTAALAAIRRMQDGRTEWLARWNTKWGCFNLPGGHKENDETFQTCLVRELREELGLQEGRDFEVCPTPLTRLVFTAPSRSAGVDTDYVIEVYCFCEAGLEGAPDAGSINLARRRSREDLRWIDAEEIRAQRCRDGQPVSETLVRFLDAIERA